MKLNQKTEKSLIALVKEIQEARAQLSRYELLEVVKSGISKTELKTAEPNADGTAGGKYVEVNFDEKERPLRAFLKTGVAADKDEYDLVTMQAKSEFTFQGITYPKGHRKLVVQ